MEKYLLVFSFALLIFSVGAALWLMQGSQIKNPPSVGSQTTPLVPLPLLAF